MGFSVSNLSLTSAIAESLREIQYKLFHGPAPHSLHHYTKSAAVVESIVRERFLWATCIADQSDQTEISHASEMAAQLAEELQGPRIPEFALSVLKRLPFFMEERKRWIFIACFCDSNDSGFHWREYGDYRLTFPFPRASTPSLTLSDPQAECWYQRVVYDERLQRVAIERSLRSISHAISHNTSGRNEGPWAQSMVDNCARNAAQLLLGIVVGFKRSSFQAEREWRIVCAPRLGTNSSAPRWIDESFAVNIKSSPRRHVLLRIQPEPHPFQPPLIPPVPLSEWAWNPNRLNREGVEKINEALKVNHRADLVHVP